MCGRVGDEVFVVVCFWDGLLGTHALDKENAHCVWETENDIFLFLVKYIEHIKAKFIIRKM